MQTFVVKQQNSRAMFKTWIKVLDSAQSFTTRSFNPSVSAANGKWKISDLVQFKSRIQQAFN